MEQLHAILDVSWRLTFDELADQMPQISRTSIYHLMTDVPVMQKLAARWVPRNFSEEQKIERVTISCRLLQRQQGDPDCGHR